MVMGTAVWGQCTDYGNNWLFLKKNPAECDEEKQYKP